MVHERVAVGVHDWEALTLGLQVRDALADVVRVQEAEKVRASLSVKNLGFLFSY